MLTRKKSWVLCAKVEDFSPIISPATPLFTLAVALNLAYASTEKFREFLYTYFHISENGIGKTQNTLSSKINNLHENR